MLAHVEAVALWAVKKECRETQMISSLQVKKEKVEKKSPTHMHGMDAYHTTNAQRRRAIHVNCPSLSHLQ